MNNNRIKLVKGLMPNRVYSGDRPKAATINKLIEHGGRRTINESLIPFRSSSSVADESKDINGLAYTSSTAIVYFPKIYYNGAWRSGTTPSIITLSGSESYVYVSLNKTSLVVTVKQSATVPTPSGSEFNLIIAHFTASGAVYTLTNRYWKGAYYAEAPIP